MLRSGGAILDQGIRTAQVSSPLSNPDLFLEGALSLPRTQVERGRDLTWQVLPVTGSSDEVKGGKASALRSPVNEVKGGKASVLRCPRGMSDKFVAVAPE